jgi:ketosteroid isomerase-like protein
MKADAKTEKAILGLLKGFSDNFSLKDIDGTLSLFAEGADVVMLGSEDWEMGVGSKNLRPVFQKLFSRKESFSWDWKWHTVSSSGSVAWVLATGDIHTHTGKADVPAPYRLSAVFEKQGDKWLLMQFHGSQPVITAVFDNSL